MEQRRFILFVLLSTLVLIGWLNVGPLLFPNWFPKPPPKGNQPAAVENVPDGADEEPGEAAAPADADEQPAAEGEGDEAAIAVEGDPAGADEADAEDELPSLPEFPERTVTLGSLDRESGYFLEAKLTTRGAAVESVTLNDPRYIKERKRGGADDPLQVVGNNGGTSLDTLETDVPRIDALLEKHGLSLREVDWDLDEEFVKDHTDGNGIVSAARFRYPSPDGRLEVVKTFAVHPGDPDNPDRDTDGYLIDFRLELINTSDEALTAEYLLQGPVGLPLENVENTRTFIELKVGTAVDPGDPVQLTAGEVVEQVDDGELDVWREPLRYVGVDVQYFAALLIPAEDQLVDRDGDAEPDPYFVELAPVLVTRANKPKQSDVSVVMQSRELTIPSNGSVAHEFQLFTGPKRPELLEPLDATGIISFGWFGWISEWMVWVLNLFHTVLLLPYGACIILLTLIVRACMFPITRKQAAGAKKMKELQPEMQRLKDKYSKEPEKFWQAQRELFRKHNYHPLAGCLPLFLQMPIFFGLYSALNMDVDLRMAEFLWIDNLAAPDALFELPFTIPLLGWTQFNLLPLLTIALWIMQQKMFMPPATTDEQKLQQKMMTYMMVFFGFMIYRVPAGLCVYFITSTLWGLTERKILDFTSDESEKQGEEPPEERRPPRGEEPPSEPKPPGLWERLLEAADQARQQTNGQSQRAKEPAPRSGSRKKGGGKRKRSRPRR